MEEIKIDIPQFNMRAQRVIELFESYCILYDDRLDFYCKIKVETPKDGEDPLSQWVQQNWLYKGFVFKERISGLNVRHWDTSKEFPVCTLYVEVMGLDELKFSFPSIPECNKVYKIIYDWLLNKEPPAKNQPEG